MKKLIIVLLLITPYLNGETKYKFRGFVESKGLGSIVLNSNGDSIEREFHQGFSILSNQYIKIIPEDGISIVASINQTILSGVGSDDYSKSLENDDFSLYGAQDSYIVGLDIERLYFSYRNGSFKTSFGVQRLSRGFNFAFTPFDFINKNNVATSNAPQGKLSLLGEFETTDFSSLSIYFLPSTKPTEREIWASTTGILIKQYDGVFDFQAQYNLHFPEYEKGEFEHLLGLAFKGDHIVGYSTETVYKFSDLTEDIDYLDIALGFDYTFDFKKELGVRVEYMYREGGINSRDKWDIYSRDQYPFKHNFFCSLNQYINDDLTLELSAVISPLTTSVLPMVNIDYRVSNSSYLTLSVDVPMDSTNWNLNNVNSDNIGEYGPLRVGNELYIAIIYKIKY